MRFATSFASVNPMNDKFGGLVMMLEDVDFP